MKRILVSGLSATYGGIERFILNFLVALKDEDIHFDLLFSDSNFTYREILNEANYSVVPINPRRSNPSYRSDLAAILEIGHYDAVWAHVVSTSDLEVIELAAIHGVGSRIVHSHLNSPSGGLITRLLARLNEKKLKYATDYWACSQEAGEFLFSSGRLDDQVRVIPNSIDTERFAFDSNKREEIRMQLNLKGRFVLMSVARLEPVKNIEFIINLLPGLLELKPEIAYVVFGDGTSRTSLQRLIDEKDLSDYVILAGFTDSTSSVYSAADLLVMPSLVEGFPFTIVEAQANGLEILASTNIPRSTDIGNRISFLPLDSNIWIDSIVKHIDSSHQDEVRSLNVVKGTDYDLAQATQALVELLI